MNRFLTRAAVGALVTAAIATGSTISARAASDMASASATGAGICGTTETCTGTAAGASVDGTGEANVAYSIPPSTSASITSGATGVIVDTFKSTPTLTGALDGIGAQTLTVGATFNVRILMRKPRDLPSGEYRSNMLIRACHACESICGSEGIRPTDSPGDRLLRSSMHPAVLSVLLNLRCGIHQRLAEDREDSCEICSRSLRITY